MIDAAALATALMVMSFMESEMEYEKDVHTEHCCSKHGCKYGHADCPVENGLKPQSYPCEYCAMDAEYLEQIPTEDLVSELKRRGDFNGRQ